MSASLDSNIVKPLVAASVVLGSMMFAKSLFRSNWSCQGKTIMITGASSGIGAALSRYLYT